MSRDGTHVIKLGNYWRITSLPLRSWIAPLYMYQQSMEQAKALYKLDQQRFVGREILSNALLNSDWTSGFFLLILRAYHGLPQPAACSTLCMHYMHAHTHALQSSVIGHLRPGHDKIVYKKCLVHIYTAVTWATLLSLSWRESVYISHVNCLLFWCAVYTMLSSGAIFCALRLACLVKCCTPCDMRASLFSIIYILYITYVLSPGLRNRVQFSLLLPPKNAFIPPLSIGAS